MKTVTDISDGVLTNLLAGHAPVISVYYALDARPEQEEDAELRWKALVQQLAEQTTDGREAMQAVARQALAALPGSGTLAAFASDGELVHVTEMPGGRQTDLVMYGPLPHLLPVLEWRQDHPAYVLAVCDRTGADLEICPEAGTRPVRETVDGPDDEIVRNAPGGWSQMRYQHRAEDSWEHNAAHVADALSRAVARVSARVVLLAGDVRAVQYVTKHLPKAVRHQVRIRGVSGSRSHDGAFDGRRAQVEAERRGEGERQTRELLQEMAEERGPRGRTVEGVRETTEALARGQVRTLVLTHDPSDTRTAWFGPGPTDIADREMPDRGGPRLSPGSLADVAARAALLTDADVRVVPPGTEGAPAHGVGALLRYT
ncbi:Vms1/Ankzf1 family peptidyl-tRNA hydrolase [Streptomyces sp. WMMB 322]|uniref:baeRF2 domain-containing protein n=1 Tax=Streptomyces sp. WMMB 322 TaxID=1286821 RepID=UPI0006E40212|nr:Vms1/Ankzf1 family peptidyl-tRNA hydrolase [Streptomyces sp. WMMB 322]SCK43691.1 hypothetical protein H180DRAFT_03833 [Streptomyces sp. WMMB 322]